jgi:diguanylate cyclase (GGDEF)-like protein/PAS domain S-box-containing protein
MAERVRPGPESSKQELLAEIARQDKIIRALMNQAERSRMDADGSDFGAFQTAIILERQVRRRTAELESALRDNEKITRQLRNSEARFRSVIGQPLVGIAVLEDGKFTFANAKFDATFGYSADELSLLGLTDVVVEDDKRRIVRLLDKQLGGELKSVDCTFRGRRKNGTEIDIELHSCVTELGEKTVIVAVVQDISERMRAEREAQALYALLREQSIRDPLTGLFNRRYFDAALERELTLAQRHGHPVSVMMCDFDHFKGINDGYGHLAGDEVLRTFAAMMMNHCRGSDIACRYGGEEFVLVMPDMPATKALERAELLRATIETTPAEHGDLPLRVTASFGVASYPQCGKNAVELLAATDTALYGAKRGGRNRVEGAWTITGSSVSDNDDSTPGAGRNAA